MTGTSKEAGCVMHCTGRFGGRRAGLSRAAQQDSDKAGQTARGLTDQAVVFGPLWLNKECRRACNVVRSKLRARRPRIGKRHSGYHFLLRVRSIRRTFAQPTACGLPRDTQKTSSADAKSQPNELNRRR
ncbi:hypothetical protein [Paraburkholderia sp. SIMBA_030]|uniref:hypothetical protein n=1 Tax=Paraburkholderia sp. SIMBA_030 TaxID=3085773 RepID=UPI00397E54E1